MLIQFRRYLRKALVLDNQLHRQHQHLMLIWIFLQVLRVLCDFQSVGNVDLAQELRPVGLPLPNHGNRTPAGLGFTPDLVVERTTVPLLAYTFNMTHFEASLSSEMREWGCTFHAVPAMPNLERPNRLALEKSPYLLQHAHNPVDWYAWGQDAFDKARKEDKPIFLSIGYSTCHWCHVMERESFENNAVAEVLNREFVPVKVDREERPDVDRIYMAFVQATSGGGGWPMSVFLTPALEPFFGGTYFPPDSRFGRPGFTQLLEYLARKWHTERSEITEAGSHTLDQLKRMADVGDSSKDVDQASVDRVFSYFRRSFDSKLGGFGHAPKFPRPVVHNFLLRYYAATGNQEAVDMVAFTLSEMAKGGMNDQVGGGFHRYSVDERWFVPHFEKMLYDQAQLASSYLEGFQITGDSAHAETARTIFEYVLRDLTHPEGGFYSAEDADSVIDDEPGAAHKGEGAFYTWKESDLRQLLDPTIVGEFCSTYGVRPNGNVDEDPHHEFGGKNILYVAREIKNTVAMAAARGILLNARASRTRPHLDDKVLTSWNGLMISAFAQGARILNDPQLLDAATRAAHFILRHLYKPEEGRLMRRFRDGDAAIPGFLDDYAFFIQGLLDLFEASHETYYFQVALQLATSMVELFEDEERGGFYSTSGTDSSLVMRMKDDYDGAEPSGNSYAAQVLLKLAHLTGREDFRLAAGRTFKALSGKLAEQGPALPQMLAVWIASQTAPRQIVLAGPRDAAMEAMLRSIAQHFLPFTTTILLDSEATRDALAPHLPTLAAMTAKDGHATAYVCENFACQLPVTEVEALAKLLS